MCPARNPPTAATATTPAIAAKISSGFRFLAGLSTGPFDNGPAWGTIGAAWLNSASGLGATVAGRAGFGTRFGDPHCGHLSAPPARLSGASISAPHCPHLNSITAHLPFAPCRGTRSQTDLSRQFYLRTSPKQWPAAAGSAFRTPADSEPDSDGSLGQLFRQHLHDSLGGLAVP